MEKILFDESNILSRRLVCSYFDYGSPTRSTLGLVQFESRVSKAFFCERCGPRIDQFIQDSLQEFDSDDEADPVMIDLRAVGPLPVSKMIESHPAVLFNLVTAYQLLEVVADLMPPEGAMAEFLLYKIYTVNLIDEMVAVTGEAHKLRQS